MKRQLGSQRLYSFKNEGTDIFHVHLTTIINGETYLSKKDHFWKNKSIYQSIFRQVTGHNMRDRTFFVPIGYRVVGDQLRLIGTIGSDLIDRLRGELRKYNIVLDRHQECYMAVATLSKEVKVDDLPVPHKMRLNDLSLIIKNDTLTINSSMIIEYVNHHVDQQGG